MSLTTLTVAPAARLYGQDSDTELSRFSERILDSSDLAEMHQDAALLRNLVTEAKETHAVEAALESLLNRLVQDHKFGLLKDFHFQYPAGTISGAGGLRADLDLGPVGPRLREPLTTFQHYSLLGKSIGLPMGMPAGVTTSTPEWVGYFASNGFNVLTTRTFRTRKEPGFGEPHFRLIRHYPRVDTLGQRFRLEDEPGGGLRQLMSSELAAINSYGIPSPTMSDWKILVQGMLSKLTKYQMLIVSVVGEGKTGSDESIADDFADAAINAVAGGATAIELNLSFPVTRRGQAHSPDEGIYSDNISLCELIVDTVAQSILGYNVAIVAKLGWMSESHLKNVARALGPRVHGISGINAVPVNVIDGNGNPVFSGRPALPRISGAALTPLTRNFVETLSNVRAHEGEYFDIIASGGVMQAEDAIVLRELGADAIQSATGAFINPFLAWDVYQEAAAGRFSVSPGDRSKYRTRLAMRRPFMSIRRGSGPYVPADVWTDSTLVRNQ